MEDLLGVKIRSTEPVAARRGKACRTGELAAFTIGCPRKEDRCRFPRSAVVGAGLRWQSRKNLRFAVEPEFPARTNGHESMYLREGELMSKLHELLHSPMGESGVMRILEELHGLLPRVAFFDLIREFDTRSRFIG